MDAHSCSPLSLHVTAHTYLSAPWQSFGVKPVLDLDDNHAKLMRDYLVRLSSNGEREKDSSFNIFFRVGVGSTDVLALLIHLGGNLLWSAETAMSNGL